MGGGSIAMSILFPNISHPLESVVCPENNLVAVSWIESTSSPLVTYGQLLANSEQFGIVFDRSAFFLSQDTTKQHFIFSWVS